MSLLQYGVTGAIHGAVDKYWYAQPGYEMPLKIGAQAAGADWAACSLVYSGRLPLPAAIPVKPAMYTLSGLAYLGSNKLSMWDPAPMSHQFFAQIGSSFMSDMLTPSVSSLYGGVKPL